MHCVYLLNEIVKNDGETRRQALEQEGIRSQGSRLRAFAELLRKQLNV